MKINLSLLIIFIFYLNAYSQKTYAEKLGFPKGKKVLILHVDDVGMSHDSNQGTIKALEDGIASSLSIMMPCPWVPEFMNYLKEHPKTDAGLHLTLTSEWKNYRWGPLSGKESVPGLVDTQWMFWPTVPQVAQSATADEVETEIRAQIKRSRDLGLEPTHLDSHMGALFARPDFLQRYIKVGIEENIPVMFPGGHNTYIAANSQVPLDPAMTKQIGEKLWNAGFPVLDDLHPDSYGWNKSFKTDKELADYKVNAYIRAIDELKPGITMMIMHCTLTSENFKHISADSEQTRKGDLLAMLDPKLKKYIKDNGIVITNWRELKERRAKVK